MSTFRRIEDRLLIPVTATLGIVVLGLLARGDRGLDMILLMPQGMQARLFRLWWRAQAHPVTGGSPRPSDVIVVGDATDPARAETLEMLQFREKVLSDQSQHGIAMIWNHMDFPIDPKCNPTVLGSVSPSRGCEVAAARRLAESVGKARVLDEWLLTDYQADDPESIRFEVARLTGEDNWAERVPDWMAKVRKDVQRAQELGVRAIPVININGTEIHTSKSRVISWAIEAEIDRLKASEGYNAKQPPRERFPSPR